MSKFGFILMVLFFFIIAMAPLGSAARFDTGEVTTIINRDVYIYVRAETSETGVSSESLTLSISPATGGEIKFEESGADSMTVYLLPEESKSYRAVFSSDLTGSYTIDLATDGSLTDSISVTVTQRPEFPESGLYTVFSLIILAAIIFFVAVRK